MAKKDPFKHTNPDVIVAEALMFFWQFFLDAVQHAVGKRELTKADFEAVANAGTAIVILIHGTTGWDIADFFGSRIERYGHREPVQTSIETFTGVLLRSRGKKSVHDPDHRPFSDNCPNDDPSDEPHAGLHGNVHERRG